ncbi:hypothetical protein HBI56_227860 [Parastagonospora nodorum]|uniref:Uncharacterized protein n=2 Tax=Phaeosphaeria nodorum (strain SN15 / ATCC MYA-4574 / FGSC 10173) TaxID=321614 RepID=A0A7U2IAV0_PHANO|nr:hypothetical protein HBH56_160610 [Parastagonospora nodorum]QRD06305.1 hypothetical protein JI435_116950 [Parastagonospora nodorum SN15]KAH3931986.1 hypothetical protein HBH54_088620 [Parastagonospora nodorum]KAH3947724.1 hypothetical protein HBH53_115820 [Parastagonospora nodorum]KAH3969115.1 hypothetical protein HBH52_174370 [Parastagonospora nodorum]
MRQAGANGQKPQPGKSCSLAYPGIPTIFINNFIDMELNCMMTEIDAIESESTKNTHRSGNLTEVFDVSYMIRGKLLEGLSSVLLTSHTCTDFDIKHQLSTAKGMVNADRMRQLLEQAEDSHRHFSIEFPTWALTAASPLFKQCHEAQPGLSAIPVKLGNLLPGYVMCVLDWYGHALQNKHWNDFLPESPSVDGHDKWYWVYCYAAMRVLGLNDFAAQLQMFIESIIDDLATNISNYAHLLNTLRADDPIMFQLAWYTVMNLQQPSPHLTQLDCETLAEHFPQFAGLVNTILQAH